MSQHPHGDRPKPERKRIRDTDGVEYFEDDLNEHYRRNGEPTLDERQHSALFLWEDGEWDVNAIPPRPWLAPPYLMRGHITLLHGPGSNGKSLISLYWAVAVALGKPFGRLRPVAQAARVILANFEEDRDEQHRRLSAALDFFGAKPADLAGKLRRVSLGKVDPTMFTSDDGGTLQLASAFEALLWHCKHFAADLVVLDPFISINAVAENDNTLIRRVMTVLRRQICHDHHCALALAHHDVKNGGQDVDSDQNNARGAGDIINAVRFEAAVRNMGEEQAKKLLPEGEQEQRRNFFRVGSEASKRNITKPEDSEWFERFAVMVSHGEDVVACRPWEPPRAFADISVTDANAILDRIAEGMADGARYSDNRRPPGTRWAGHILVEEYGKTIDQANKIIKTWLKNNVLKIVEFETSNRKQANGLEVVDANRPG